MRFRRGSRVVVTDTVTFNSKEQPIQRWYEIWSSTRIAIYWGHTKELSAKLLDLGEDEFQELCANVRDSQVLVWYSKVRRLVWYSPTRSDVTSYYMLSCI